jgi:phosphate transport system permease protein
MKPKKKHSQKANLNFGDKLFHFVTFLLAILVLLIIVAMFLLLFVKSWPSLTKFGWRFLTSSAWDPVFGRFGALPLIFGTLVSSAIALFLAVPIGVGVAIFLSEVAPAWMYQPLSFLVEVLASIPSVVYGLWGLFVLAPWIMNYLAPFLKRYLGFLPLFSGNSYGVGMLAAGLILSLMIVPYIVAVSREILDAVPDNQREAALALGLTKWESIKIAVLPYGRAGIVGAIMLALGRALGETMAVTMVIGNTPKIAASLFAPGYSMAAVIANEFTEASNPLYLSALIEVGLLLFVITLIVNSLARWLVVKIAGPTS